MTRSFDGDFEHALMTGAGSGRPPRNDFALFGDEPGELFLISIIDEFVFVFTKPTDFPLLHHSPIFLLLIVSKLKIVITKIEFRVGVAAVG